MCGNEEEMKVSRNSPLIILNITRNKFSCEILWDIGSIKCPQNLDNWISAATISQGILFSFTGEEDGRGGRRAWLICFTLPFVILEEGNECEVVNAGDREDEG